MSQYHPRRGKWRDAGPLAATSSFLSPRKWMRYAYAAGAFQPQGDRREAQAHALRMMQSNSGSGSTVPLVGSCIILRLLLGETNNPSLFKSGSSNKYWYILTGMLEYRYGFTGILEYFLE